MADHLDELLKQARALKKPLDLVDRFRKEPQLIEYVRQTMEQRDKVLAVSRKYDGQMRKISALVQGDDHRFNDDPELRNCLDQYGALASAASRIPAGESWLANLDNEDFLRNLPDTADWWPLTVARKLWELREHFGSVHGASASMEHFAQMALARVADIEYRHPAPILKFRRAYEPEASPRRSNLDE
jgi:hypothetical protein